MNKEGTNGMKNLITAMLIALALTGCAATPKPEIVTGGYDDCRRSGGVPSFSGTGCDYD